MKKEKELEMLFGQMAYRRVFIAPTEKPNGRDSSLESDLKNRNWLSKEIYIRSYYKVFFTFIVKINYFKINIKYLFKKKKIILFK